MASKKSPMFKFLNAWTVAVRAPAAIIAKLCPKPGEKVLYADGDGSRFTRNGCVVEMRGAGWVRLHPFGQDADRAMADLAEIDNLITEEDK